MQTIFNELDGVVPWKIYFHDFPQAALLSRLWPHFANFRFFQEFVDDAAAGCLPGYSFIEPMYFPAGDAMPNDMHPPHDIGFGDCLVARVYNAVRSSPNWPSTLMIVLFDEHGGCYDHVPPPPAVPPEIPRPNQTFGFDRFGVRVPAIVISPYTTQKVLRSDGPEPYDHTSVITTIRNCFGINGALTARDAAAPDLSAALNAEFDMTRGPLSIPVLMPAPNQATLAATLAKPVNGLQELLHAFAHKLIPVASGISVNDHLTNIIASSSVPPKSQGSAPRTVPTAETAGLDVRQVMQGILSRYAQVQETLPPAPSNHTVPRARYRGH